MLDSDSRHSRALGVVMYEEASDYLGEGADRHEVLVFCKAAAAMIAATGEAEKADALFALTVAAGKL